MCVGGRGRGGGGRGEGRVGIKNGDQAKNDKTKKIRDFVTKELLGIRIIE